MDLTSRFPFLGGELAETASLRGVLAYLGFKAHHNHQTPSEAMLFGIGGGIGAGYFVYQSGDFTSLFLGTRITTKETAREGFIHNICTRLGVKARPLTATTPAAAEGRMLKALEGGQPVIVWVDPSRLPYPAPPAAYHCLVVTGFDSTANLVKVFDRRPLAVEIPLQALAAARQGEGAHKFRALVLEADADEIDLQPAVMEGLRENYRQMVEGFGPANFRSNFGLKALEKWAGLLIDRRDPRGWPRFFPPGPRLFSALLSVYEQIENRGDGSAYRPIYANFLEEAASLLEKPELHALASEWRASARLWHTLANISLPVDVPQFAEAKALLDQKKASFEHSITKANSDWQAANRWIKAIRQECAQAFPLSEKQVDELLRGLHETIMEIYSLESQAVKKMGASI